MSFIDTVSLLFLSAVGLSLLADRLAVPYPSMLIVGGLALVLVPGIRPIQLDPGTVLSVFLPPVLFEAAYNAYWRELRRDRLLIAALSILLVFATTATVTGAALLLFPGIPLWVAIVLGAVLSPSDSAAPVAILARMRVSSRIIAVITGESLMNDTASILLYKTAIAGALTGVAHPQAALGALSVSTMGGLGFGVATGLIGAWLIRATRDHLTYSLLTVGLAYLSYLGADRLGWSGVLSAVTAGSLCGLRALPRVSAQFRFHGGLVWEVVIFALNAFGFVLIGLQLPTVIGDLSYYELGDLALYAGAICLTVLATRIAFLLATTGIEHRIRPGAPISWRESAVVGWSGMRGIVTLIAALALPVTMEGSVFPYRDLILFLAFALILFTLVVQVPTLPLLVRRLRLTGDMGSREETMARIAAANAALKQIDRLADDALLPDGDIEHLRAEYSGRLMAAQECPDQLPVAAAHTDTLSQARLEIIESERGALLALRRGRQVGDEVVQKLVRELDLAELALTHGGSGHAAG
jgi:CPA1 family monovalent cation:H+ antiporter